MTADFGQGFPYLGGALFSHNPALTSLEENLVTLQAYNVTGPISYMSTTSVQRRGQCPAPGGVPAQVTSLAEVCESLGVAVLAPGVSCGAKAGAPRYLMLNAVVTAAVQSGEG